MTPSTIASCTLGPNAPPSLGSNSQTMTSKPQIPTPANDRGACLPGSTNQLGRRKLGLVPQMLWLKMALARTKTGLRGWSSMKPSPKYRGLVGDPTRPAERKSERHDLTDGQRTEWSVESNSKIPLFLQTQMAVSPCEWITTTFPLPKVPHGLPRKTSSARVSLYCPPVKPSHTGFRRLFPRIGG